VNRLTNMIKRLETQRLCLNEAARLIQSVSGPAVEIGLGKGRTYSHLCEILGKREIYAFDGSIHAPADAVPDSDHMIVGDFKQTLPQIPEIVGAAPVFAHADFGSEDRAADAVLASEVAASLAACLAPNSVVASDRAMEGQGWAVLPLPDGCLWPYFMYRVPAGSA